MDVLTDLNPVQREAVLQSQGPMLVLAGAGSGKTRILVQRIAHLVLRSRVPAHSILAVTFTTKAAREMRERLAAAIGQQAGQVWMGTFHSVCLRMLRRHGARVGLQPGFAVLDETASRRLLKDAIQSLGLDADQVDARRFAGYVSRAKSNLLTPDQVAHQRPGPRGQRLAAVYHAYQERLASLGAVDFDDLLARALGLLRACPDVLAGYQRRFRHVLVDEYQDTNPAQYEVLRELTARHRNLFAVGDEDQSIYSWRAADIRNILRFRDDFPDATIIKLEQNYRSTQIILDAANRVIANNLLRNDKQLWTANPRGEPLTLYEAADERDEARWVATRIAAALQEGAPPDGLAVLYRVNAQARLLEEELSRRSIPYRVLAGRRFYERAEVQDTLALLALARQEVGDATFQRAVGIAGEGIGDATLERLAALAAARAEPMHQVAQAIVEGEVPEARRLGRARLTALAHFVALANRLARLSCELSLAELMEATWGATGYQAALGRLPAAERAGRLEGLEELLTVAREFNADPAAMGALDEFLSRAAQLGRAGAGEPQAAVTLSTLHGAKGLEFDLLFLVGVEEDLLPHRGSRDEQEALEEERRLFYVGMTRARRHLHLSYACQRTGRGQAVITAPSRFLDEIPRALVRLAHSPEAATAPRQR